jgi:stearoyl-CoA desaturase (delta-9 desaturase)
MQSWTLSILMACLLSQMSAFTTTVYLHRGITHGGIRFHKSVDVFFRTILWLLTGIIPKQWVAVHRKHHKFTDVEGDPHSPFMEGFWNIQLFNYRYYLKHIADKKTIEQFASDLRDDWLDKYVFNRKLLGLCVSTGLLCLFLGWWGLLASGLSMIIYILTSSTINGLCHWLGRKNFNNTATNLQSVAFFSAGEGLHNNHHAFPACPKLSMRWFEVDPAWPVIRVFSILGLCTYAKTVSLEGSLHKTVEERLVKK